MYVYISSKILIIYKFLNFYNMFLINYMNKNCTKVYLLNETKFVSGKSLLGSFFSVINRISELLNWWFRTCSARRSRYKVKLMEGVSL